MKYGEIDEVCDVSNLFVSVEDYSVIAERLYSSGSSGMRHVLGFAVTVAPVLPRRRPSPHVVKLIKDEIN